MVFVPRMPWSAALIGLTGGPPRAVPSDAVVALASRAIPADILQKLILLLIFVLACSGAAALLDSGWTAGRRIAGAAAGRAPANAPGGSASGSSAGSAVRSSAGSAVRSSAGPAVRSSAGSAVRSSAGAPLLARLAAGVFYAWNPYLAERLLIGQWALLLGYAGLPWVVKVVSTGPARIRPGRLLLAAIPAGVGGFAAMSVTVLAAVPAALSRGGAPGERVGRLAGDSGRGSGRGEPGGGLAGEGGERGGGIWSNGGVRGRRIATVLGVMVLLSLPWLIPAFAVAVHTDPRGVDAFAARADTPFGRIGSLIMLSGIWNAQTVPRGYGGWASAVWLLVVIASLCGYVALARSRRLSPGLGTAAVVGLAIAAVGVTSPGRAVLRDLVSAWAGFAVLRDGQQFLAPLALAEAIGLGALVAWLVRGDALGPVPGEALGRVPGGRVPGGRVPGGPVPGGRVRGSGARRPARAALAPGTPRSAGAGAMAALGVMAVLAPVVLLPGLAWGLAGRLRPAEYPTDWSRARQIIDADPARGTVLLLPWAAYRRYPWNGSEAVYDPWTKFLSREVISNDGLQIGRLILAQESSDSIRLNRIITKPGSLTNALRAAGVRYVVVDAGPLLDGARPGLAARARLPGAQVVMAGPDLLVFGLSPAAGPRR
jgi:hypothetical protein